MDRRQFIVLSGCTLATLPLKGIAQGIQRSQGLRRIGILTPYADDDPGMNAALSVFQKALEPLGWIAGKNVQFIRRNSGGDVEKLKAYAQELVNLNPDVILARATLAVQALLDVTTKIPIVFTQVTDAQRQGFVKSLSHPGGNVTGFTHFEPAICGKWLETLKEVVPGIKRVGMTYGPSAAPFAELFIDLFRGAALKFNVIPHLLPFEDPTEFENSLKSFSQQPDSGLMVIPDAITGGRRKTIISAANKFKLPAIYPFGYFAEDGGLMSYGSDPLDSFKEAATYVDHIFKGQHPGDLPVQTPTRFELVLNLKTARLIGLEIPIQVQLFADKVIE